MFQDSGGDALILSCGHRESLRLADDLGARTIAFPAISLGACERPHRSATRRRRWRRAPVSRHQSAAARTTMMRSVCSASLMPYGPAVI
ncbi:macro domain-containing protein [Streptomyces decoyicus]|uniref:macro domain-containing protein n=1 Tax=Streptomyces decoyicus TaxID=249567 RepID=UPI002E197BAD